MGLRNCVFQAHIGKEKYIMDTRPTATIGFDRTVDKEPVSIQETHEPNKRKLMMTVSFILAIAIILCFVAVMVTEIVYKISGEPSDGPSAPMNGISYINEEYSADAVHKGDLILVKEGYAYVFPNESETDIVQILSAKNDSYVVRNGKQYLESRILKQLNQFMSALEGATGFSDVQVYNGYRSYETQRDEYEGYADEVKAGFSEHHTGTCVDLNIFGGMSLSENEEVWRFMNQNAHKYGFVDRYPDDKIDITGVDHDFTVKSGRPNHFRYVGYAHAYYMHENDLCLEEYLTLLCTKYSYEGEHLTFTGDNSNTYEVYYVEATGDKTSVPVPKDYDYTVSGDNMNGFIVTVCISSPK